MPEKVSPPRAATFEDVKRLVAKLNEAGVDYLLIGGYALFAHGYHRATEDIDTPFSAAVASRSPRRATFAARFAP